MLLHALQCLCIISTEVTQQFFIVTAAIKKGLLHNNCCSVIFNYIPIEGTSPISRGTTILTMYAIHMKVTAVEYTRSPLQGIVWLSHYTLFIILILVFCVHVCVCCVHVLCVCVCFVRRRCWTTIMDFNTYWAALPEPNCNVQEALNDWQCKWGMKSQRK